MEDKDRYAIGHQDFKTLLKRGATYIDKTMFLKKIADSKTQYYFLARPRRFGKSLFLSTMKCFFEGERELFKDLYIDSTDWDWEPRPVLYLDLGSHIYNYPGALETVLDNIFRKWEEMYGISETSRLFSIRLWQIIEAAYKHTGKQVVILIDGYDKPMADNITNETAFEHCCNLLGGIYGNLKSRAEYLQMVFLTGIYQPWQFGDLHELNHLYDISDTDEYAGICGVTENELIKYLPEGIVDFALRNGISQEETLLALRERYDGYKFSSEGDRVLNPYSILNALKHSKVRNYWNETGMPSEVRAFLSNMDPSYMEYLDGVSSDLIFSLHTPNRTPDGEGLLYLNGYLTIKGYDFHHNEFVLGIPDEEVRDAIRRVIGSCSVAKTKFM